MSTENTVKTAFDVALKDFDKIITSNPSAVQAKEELSSLRLAAINSNKLSGRQKEAIAARCDNYLAGTYGKTKTAANLGYNTPTK